MFETFWSAYPNKKGKVEALKSWRRQKLEAKAHTIISDVNARKTKDPDWERGAIPHGSTYLNQQRWQDALAPDALPSSRPVAGNSPAVVDTPEDRQRKHRENAEALEQLRRDTGYAG